jgi:hypothetical protein
MKFATIGILAILAAILLFSQTIAAQVMVDYDADGFDDRNGDDPDPYDPLVPDRDGDGIRDTDDRYPDDPYNREPTQDTERPGVDTDTETTTGGNDTDDGGITWGDDMCCFINTPWFWIIVGSIVAGYGFLNRNKWRPVYSFGLIIAGIIMIIYGFSLWGVVAAADVITAWFC